MPIRDEVLGRLGLLATAAFLFATGFRIYPAVTSSGLAVAVLFLLYIGAFGLAFLAMLTPAPAGRSVQWLIGAFAAFGLSCSVAYGIHFEIPTYGTDVLALAHAGGEVLLDGINPYSASQADVQPILDGLALREGLVTETLSGQPIDGVTYYPGLHILTYAAGIALGVSDLRWVTFAVELIALTAIWLTVSERVRFILPAVLLVEPYLMINFTTGGVTDWLWVLPLTLGAIALHRENYTASGIWVGLACAVKQQPWFALPFLLIWVYRTSLQGASSSTKQAMKESAMFAAMVAVGFILPNLPFLLWSIEDWISAVLGPALLDLVPSGQGLVLLVTQGYLGLTRAGFGVLLLVAMSLISIVYFALFARIRNALWLLPALVLFFSYRSLHNYFVFWMPLVVLWLDLRVLRRGEGTAESRPTSA